MLDLCKKLNQRLDHMERSLHERKPTICPTPRRTARRRNRCCRSSSAGRCSIALGRDRCEPAIRCEPGIRCEPSIRCETPCEQPVFHHTQSMPLESMPFPGTPVQSTPLPAPIRIVPPETEAIARRRGPPMRKPARRT